MRDRLNTVGGRDCGALARFGVLVAARHTLKCVVDRGTVSRAELLQQEPDLRQPPEDGSPILVSAELSLQGAVRLHFELQSGLPE